MGNLLFFFGRDVYNAYSAKLHGNPLIRAVEIYLALAALGHVLSGVVLTLRYKNLGAPPDGKASSWFVRARLALTGGLILAFVIKHLLDLRFSESALKGTPSGDRDMYNDLLGVVRDPQIAALYASASIVVGAHLAWGWEKAVKKIKVGPAEKSLANADAVATVGQAVAMLATSAFVAVAVAAHLAAQSAQ